MYLAGERAESEGIKKSAVTDDATVCVGDCFATRPAAAGLRPLIQKHNLGTVNHIGLNPSCYVHKFLNLGYPYHVMV